jgi:hypothetical protein
MATSKQIHRLATNPTDMIRFQRTGRLPQGVVPASPLITLLESIPASDRGYITGVTVDPRLGYNGNRIFSNAAQALLWLRPSPEVFGSFPAESWRDKHFQRQLTLDDLSACCAEIPKHVREGMESRTNRRLRP